MLLGLGALFLGALYIVFQPPTEAVLLLALVGAIVSVCALSKEIFNTSESDHVVGYLTGEEDVEPSPQVDASRKVD